MFEHGSEVEVSEVKLDRTPVRSEVKCFEREQIFCKNLFFNLAEVRSC